MKVTPVKPAFLPFDKDDRADDERKRLLLFLQLIEGMKLPAGRVEMLHDETARFHVLKWLDRNIAVKNSEHENYSQARNLLTMILKNEFKKR